MKPHEECRCEPDGKTTISYSPPDPREDNKRPWHKHTLPPQERQTMKAKHARLIRYGIKLARMNTEDAAGPLGSWLLPKLTIRAYVREDVNVLKRILRGCRINTVELQPAVDLTAAILADPIAGDGGNRTP